MAREARQIRSLQWLRAGCRTPKGQQFGMRWGREPKACRSHYATQTEEALRRTSEHVSAGVLAVLRGQRPQWCVNPEVLAR